MELEIVKAGETEGAAFIHPETAKAEGIYDGNIILFEDPTTGNFGAAPVYTYKIF
ncbi:MAG: hypothetical protein ACTSV0_01120 [Candidatus Freyarchaeota archaeon]